MNNPSGDRSQQKIYNLKVLLVNSEILKSRSLKSMLDSCLGFNQSNISMVESGFMALQTCAKTHFDLILMDLHLHIMNGFETCRKIKAQRNSYIVALSETPIDKLLIL